MVKFIRYLTKIMFADCNLFKFLFFYIEDLLKLNMGSSLEVCMYNDFRDRKLSLKSFVILS